jgi:hypothetical protein
MTTHFRHSLVLAYAFPASVLAPLVPPGLEVDTYGDLGFVAVALVQTEALRPVGLPSWAGKDFFLSGYRIFVRHHDASGRMRRGLHILRSDTDRRSMVWGGNALTHYRYRLAEIRVEDRGDNLEVQIVTPGGEADLHVVADLSSRPAPFPASSPFVGNADARRFAGPLPWTFDYEPQTDSIIMIRGRRSSWHPQPVAVEVKQCTFVEHRRFGGASAVLANAFYVADLDYRWDRGVRMALGS